MTLFDDKQQSHALDRFFTQEKRLDPNPFMATRILQHIESTLKSREQRHSFLSSDKLRPVLIGISFLTAIFIGIFAGRQGSNSYTAQTENSDRIEMLKSQLFIQDFMDDDKTFLDNQ